MVVILTILSNNSMIFNVISRNRKRVDKVEIQNVMITLNVSSIFLMIFIIDKAY